ncbi:hypothetical protein ABZ408_38830 [Streptomyces tibetensis]|uniref:hypothetical protein n=1 Tax=Streptomyces tibetensis TaxID=2382123 RepID=UPI00340C78D4
MTTAPHRRKAITLQRACRQARPERLSHLLRIAEACALKAERVSQIARGTTSVTALTTVEGIAAGLCIPGALLGLAA